MRTLRTSCERREVSYKSCGEVPDFALKPTKSLIVRVNEALIEHLHGRIEPKEKRHQEKQATTPNESKAQSSQRSSRVVLDNRDVHQLSFALAQ